MADLDGREQMHAYYKEVNTYVRVERREGKLRTLNFQELKVLPGGPQPNSTFEVERILCRRETPEGVEYFCTFRHYPRQFNRWVKRSDLVK